MDQKHAQIRAYASYNDQPSQPILGENTALFAQSPPHHDNFQDLNNESEATNLSLPRHKRMVTKMNDEEIAAENNSRQEIRATWRNGDIGDTTYIEDSWKSLWEKSPVAEKGLYQWPCSDAERQCLQLDLVDALHSATDDEDWPGRGLRVLSCWIKSCYRRDVLTQPNDSDKYGSGFSTSVPQDHVRAVRISIYIVSIVYKHEFPKVNQTEDLEKVWSTAISDTEIKMRPERPHVEVNSGKDPFVAVGDINLKDLQSIGQLRILWTPYWDEHFELQTLWTTNVLKLYWFTPPLSKYLIRNGLCGGLDEHDWSYVTDEIYSTISLILSSSSKSLEARTQYEQLEAPSWLALLANPILNSWKPEQEPDGFTPPPVGDSLSKFRLNNREQLSKFGLNHEQEDTGKFWAFCLETADHMTTEWPSGRRLPHERLKISHFPFYHERLRELRVYMDFQQPRGLREL
ncbi:MAG: hypothetical protein Q9212_002679 [Teloschistes hypoglaucus]